MDKQTLIDKATSILRKVGLKAEVIQLEQMKLADGVTIVEADSFEAGKAISIVTEGGTVAMPIGEYDLEDGRKLIVAEDGYIAEVKDAEAPETETEVEVEVNAPEAVKPVAEMETIAPVKRTVESTVKETYFEEMEALKKKNEELEQKIQELSEQKPTEEVVELSEEVVEVKPIVHNPESAKPVQFGIKGSASIEQNVKQWLYK